MNIQKNHEKENKHMTKRKFLKLNREIWKSCFVCNKSIKNKKYWIKVPIFDKFDVYEGIKAKRQVCSKKCQIKNSCLFVSLDS